MRGITRDGGHHLLLVTLCEVNRHRTPDDCWLVCRTSVYDVSAFKKHPGGLRSFMRRVGGVDTVSVYVFFSSPFSGFLNLTRNLLLLHKQYQDFMFHSGEGKRMWSNYLVGKLVPCVPSEEEEAGERGGFGACVVS